MVTVGVSWDTSYRIIAALLPRPNIFEEVSEAGDLDSVLAIEALTNPRLREAAGFIGHVAVEDRVVGPGAAFVMAPFAYPHVGRFSDGTYGVYYAARELRTAIEETKYHRTLLWLDTSEAPFISENRVVEAALEARMADAQQEPNAPELLSTVDYGPSIVFGRRIYERGWDGIIWPSVRHQRGICVGGFRPRLFSDARTTAYLGYRWNGRTIDDVFEIASLTGEYPADPGARLGV